MASRRFLIRESFHLVGGALLIALGAQLSLTMPGSPVPQTGQTLGVLVVGILLGSLRGASATALYVVMGLAGLPFFAGGESGWHHLSGPTGGYLVGFVAAAAVAGWWSRRRGWRTLLAALVGMVVAHGVILLFGWSRLAFILGPVEAFTKGVLPFLIGAFVKTLVAAIIVQLRLLYLGSRG